MSILSRVLGDPNAKTIKSLSPIIGQINDFESEISKLNAEQLKAKTAEFRKRLGVETAENGQLINTLTKEQEAKILDEILPEAFAVVRETAKRILQQRHYDVQLVGGIILHRGQIAEMRTGEGKTLVATLPLYLNALTGRGVHLVTVNDYLGRVGAGWMAPVYHALGLTTSVIAHDVAFQYDPNHKDEIQYDPRLQPFLKVERRAAYACDIIYGTNNEYGFDYLRDNMAPSLETMVQRDLNFAIVDEIDSILIDEARTPLIISGSLDEASDKYQRFAQLVLNLNENEDYNVDEKLHAATLTEAGIAKMEKLLGVENIYVTGGIKDIHHIEQALKAMALYKRDKDYVVRDDEVLIVDEFTGRLMEGRRYSEGLHQAIEAKEGVKVNKESQTLATITFQNYFRMYTKLAGMTGTAMTEAEEFYKIYKLETVEIPTDKAVIRKDLDDLIYRSELGKYQAVIKEIKERTKAGQPVLVGTISIEKNEILSSLLEREGVQANILNAKNHAKEAEIIAQAGKAGSVTIATNMAGRGVDIILGGNPFNKEEHEKVKALGGLHVIGTERHESRRIDNQLRGRAGRQGDQGSSQFYVSMEDDLMRIFGGDRMKKVMISMNLPEDMPIHNKMISKSIESAQKKVEGNNFDIRKHLVEYDDVISKHRETIYRRRLNILKIAAGRQAEIQNDERKTLSEIILDLVEQEIEQVVSFHTADEYMKNWNLQEIQETMNTIFPSKDLVKLDSKKYISENPKLDKVNARTEIIDTLVVAAKENYAKIVEASKTMGFDWQDIEKSILIRSVDSLWVEHLETMDHMRRGIGLHGYGQRDPLVEYKKEAYRMYGELIELIRKQVTYSIFKVGGIEAILAPSVFETSKQKYSAPAKEMGNNSGSGFAHSADSASNSGVSFEPKAKEKHEDGSKVGRNDLCPCGSGKKFKHCHGK
jgi:preprotein translocase subunit SecA